MKRRDNRGFTLIEMLIVVGIIAVLVAVSIPMVNSSLERTKEATDAANERAALSAATIRYLENDYLDASSSTTGVYNVYYYDAIKGILIKEGDPDSYEPDPYGKCKLHDNGYIMVYIFSDGTIKMLWTPNYLPDNHLVGHQMTLG